MLIKTVYAALMNRFSIAITMSALVTNALAQHFELRLEHSGEWVDASGGVHLTIDVYGDADIGTHIWTYQFGVTTHQSPMVEHIEFEHAPWVNFFSTNTGDNGLGGIDEVS